MKLDDLAKINSDWFSGTGPKSNIAISTRMRLARNLEGHIYFNRASDKQRETTLKTVIGGMKESKTLKNALFLNVKDLSDLDKRFLVERHLMSREHAADAARKGMVIDQNEILSAMINEEDHIRLQVMRSGFDIMEAWKTADETDTELGSHLGFDHSSKFGYLTSCPTNTGTGLRASVMLHLSALAVTGQIDKVFEGISKLGLTMRGFYGEGTEAVGDFFQISNQVALGHSELDILDNLERIINKIIEREEETRKKLMSRKKDEVTDRISRSFGTLKSARIITSSETVKLLSAIRLGIDLGVLEGIDPFRVNELLLMAQPAHLQKISGGEIEPHNRDIKRADLIRDKLGVDK
jgi:protein arginine kinase